jgi:hypothetical protein
MINNPCGLKPVSHITGGSWNGKTSQYYVPSSDTSVYQPGDVVVSTPGASNGVVMGTVSYGVQQIAKAGLLSNPRGVLLTVQADPLDLASVGLPATKSKNYLVNVCDDPTVVFEIQCNNTTALSPTAIGKFADIVIGTGAVLSGTQLDVTSISTSSSTLRILGISNGDFSAYTKLLVCFNFHELG